MNFAIVKSDPVLANDRIRDFDFGKSPIRAEFVNAVQDLERKTYFSHLVVVGGYFQPMEEDLLFEQYARF